MQSELGKFIDRNILAEDPAPTMRRYAVTVNREATWELTIVASSEEEAQRLAIHYAKITEADEDKTYAHAVEVIGESVSASD